MMYRLQSAKDYLVSELQYGDFTVLIDDYGSDVDFEPDGYVDSIAIFGALPFSTLLGSRARGVRRAAPSGYSAAPSSSSSRVSDPDRS